MTHLELVNKVLVRLRERQVSSVDSSSYSLLISSLVNEAKNVVEDAWDWSALRTTFSANTLAGVFSYEINCSPQRSVMLDVINDTSNIHMTRQSSRYFNDLFLNNDDPTEGSPYYYSFNGTNENGHLRVDVYPIPDGEYELRFNMVNRTGDLVANDDFLLVPDQPVLLLAIAYAIDERGEDSGQATTFAIARAQRALSDAIAQDANRFVEEITWEAT